MVSLVRLSLVMIPMSSNLLFNNDEVGYSVIPNWESPLELVLLRLQRQSKVEHLQFLMGVFPQR
jgi:hypothetical protein